MSHFHSPIRVFASIPAVIRSGAGVAGWAKRGDCASGGFRPGILIRGRADHRVNLGYTFRTRRLRSQRREQPEGRHAESCGGFPVDRHFGRAVGGSLYLKIQDTMGRAPRLMLRRAGIERVGFVALAMLVAWSAILVKESSHAPAMVALRQSPPLTPDVLAGALPVSDPSPVEAEPVAEQETTRWFNGRPVRPARTIWMTVTAYSPDSRSCGRFADGKTATLHSVWTNGMKLVAADTRLLPFGSMLTVPGYDSDQIVPVLDRGGAIKGHRLDLLFPTHRQARRWGVRRLPVIVWEYADGKPADDPRRLR